MTFKLFQDSGMISKIESLSDTSRLHQDTTDVIIYLGRYYIEMLKNGKFLYRPKGTGQGKRSKFLHIVEKFMYNQINEDGRFN